MTTSAFSLAGKALKLEEGSEIAALTRDIEFPALESLAVSGNSFGIDASIGLAQVLQKCSSIRVSPNLLSCMYLLFSSPNAGAFSDR